MTVNFQDWAKIVRHDGAVTKLEEIRHKLSGVQRDAEVVIAVASGIANRLSDLRLLGEIQRMLHSFTIPIIIRSLRS